VFIKLWSAAVRPFVLGGPQAVLEEESLQKWYQDTELMRNTPIHVCAKTSFVD
jgi:hypothetical protein